VPCPTGAHTDRPGRGTIGALPAVRTVRFAVDGDGIVFRVANGSRLQQAIHDTVVAFHADQYDEASRSAWSVQVVGVAKAVTYEVSVARLVRLPLESWSDAPAGDTFVRIPASFIHGEEVELAAT
jgi:uncharacterized protein